MLASSSEFKDIFDVKHFITTLEQYVPVVENLPEALATHEPTWKAPVSWSKVRLQYHGFLQSNINYLEYFSCKYRMTKRDMGLINASFFCVLLIHIELLLQEANSTNSKRTWCCSLFSH